MYFNDHPPPHFHARYGDFEAAIEISGLKVLDGELTSSRFEARAGMGDLHKVELLEDWRLCREKAAPARIEPLA